MRSYITVIGLLSLIVSCRPSDKGSQSKEKIIRELNEGEIAKGERTIALIGATLIDGTGSDPIDESVIIIKDDIIEAVGRKGETSIPEAAQVEDVTGLTLLPGLIDAHYHNDRSARMPNLFLSKGITSVRDPGAWNDLYDSARMSGKKIPRLFLTGPHIDMYPPAYPENSYIVRDPEEARLAVALFESRGATAIKVYFRLPVSVIRAICEEAHSRGIPVTGHLEITNARDAINAGLDGIEHITSFGTCLMPLQEAEKYKQLILGDNEARRNGRYEAWNSIQMRNNPVVDSLVAFLAKKQTFITPTLAVFERQSSDRDSVQVGGFKKMVEFVRLVHSAGGKVVVGSHTWVAYAEHGFA